MTILVGWPGVLDVTGAVLILLGALLCLVAAIGLVRLPDVLNRMHAASKPQTLGLVLLCIGLALILRTTQASLMLTLAGMLQLVTAPVATQVMGRSAYRTRQHEQSLIVQDET
ncbi:MULTISPECIES: monovalent cation/H(+) antiporter subunit G [Aestuariimicrobium]|uniref:monovalent cation/H(+) antiporter subunit G n=1 Tax=Aestuariimicrobium TaxID=396388 RepID=UPI0003B50819|nr:MULTISPECIES: monovalent cation/H(+) antiporter subunit G [Aestuariimicrobium]CAI9404185.1 Na(+)/H(+) antiporter subunit G [Aestuariimicrobium sp. T2.26MG-19.2B]